MIEALLNTKMLVYLAIGWAVYGIMKTSESRLQREYKIFSLQPSMLKCVLLWPFIVVCPGWFYRKR